MRQHIGKHILRDETLKNENLCGFCGLVTGCNIELRTTSGSGIYKTLGPYSKCQFFCSFSLKAESKSSTQTPCTNRPVICSQCKECCWSYNLELHYSKNHASIPMLESDFPKEEEVKKVLSCKY